MPPFIQLKLSAKVVWLGRRPNRDQGFVKAPTDSLMLGFAGPELDCHAGLTRKSDSRTLQLYKRNIDIRNVRQLTVISVEELTDIATALGIPEIKAEWLGANMVLSGIPDLTLLPPSSRLQFPSGATIVVDMENLPCRQVADQVAEHYPDVRSNVVPAAMHKRGFTAWVEREGAVSMGDAVQVFVPTQRRYPHIS